MQIPPVGARCPVTPADGMISGYDYDSNRCMYVCMAFFPWLETNISIFAHLLLLSCYNLTQVGCTFNVHDAQRYDGEGFAFVLALLKHW